MLSAHLRVFYLHGFASSSTSRKAQFFRRQLASLGIELGIPDLSEDNFQALTISGQLKVIERETAQAAARGERVVLIGSSLGGYLAALHAACHPAVDRLILLAPAFNFYQLWTTELGTERLALWKENGSIPIFHYGEGRELPLGFQLMEDAERYEPFPVFPQPALLFHGTRDPLVPVSYSANYAKAHENVHLCELDSGHELTDVLEEIWLQTKPFLAL